MRKVIVYKFGGASVKDAKAIKNLSNILFNRLRNHMVVVISAIGKTTNALEEVLMKKYQGLPYSLNNTILMQRHLEICDELFEPGHRIFSVVKNYFLVLERDLERPLTKENYDQYYDQIIGYGEMLSTRIIQEYLCDQEQYCLWQDAREIIKTDENFRLANVDWNLTKKKCEKYLLPKLDKFPVVTQGFIGGGSSGKMTTLGREGSDYSAAIIAASLKAKSVVIWKDVPGVLNADPKRFEKTVKFDRLDYYEAAEMTYYGASVIHPKTIKPLANAKIPLEVKSFLNPEESGTVIGDFKESQGIPTIVVKDEQILVTFKVTDFAFINEGHIHQVYTELQRLKLKVNLLQTSAITISICIDRQIFKLEQLMDEMKRFFVIRYNEGLQLITVNNYKEEIKNSILMEKEVLVEQTTRNTFQLICKP
ncbi:aspartate kinase [Echinicola jeungdonensis]|uniref:Aspartokinase n=1 Tax=Echinicola jeungdonensis TaxID=709343 RepID=A0ABV5J3E8_9BACT|nr:aspartate kinase [Echinicola jeungdonensis]MDN3669606.1 aspartate kinase [Echinicola jeungdonensis]